LWVILLFIYMKSTHNLHCTVRPEYLASWLLWTQEVKYFNLITAGGIPSTFSWLVHLIIFWSLIDQVPFDQSCSSWICFVNGWNGSCDHVEETNRIGSTYIFTDYIVYGKLYTMCICMLGESILVNVDTVSRAILSTMVRYVLKKSKITQRFWMKVLYNISIYLPVNACLCGIGQWWLIGMRYSIHIYYYGPLTDHCFVQASSLRFCFNVLYQWSSPWYPTSYIRF